MRKLIFLDIDGVLVTRRHMEATNSQDFDPAAIRALNHLLEQTGAKVVLSSTWRYSHTPMQMMAELHRQGVKGCEIIDSTPKRWTDSTRGGEIVEWLSKNAGRFRDGYGFIVIDDDSDIDPFMDRLVQTSWESGLTMELAERAIAMLNGEEV